LSFIEGLHGVVAIVLLCTLLFAEEAGVPLPAPGELTLVVAGLLIATGGLDPWLFVPLAIASCVAGSVAGYCWARIVGEQGLPAAAERLHQTKRLNRVTARLRVAGSRDIGLCRLIPGLRVYTSLVAGAVGVDRRRFLLGVAPSAVLWVTVYIVIGVVVGVPAVHFLSELQGLILQGGILVIAGVGGYIAIWRIPEGSWAGLMRLPASLRSVLALGVDMALIGSVVAGVLAVVRPLTRIGLIAGWIDIVVVVVVIAVFYSIATHRGRHATAGEALLGTRYLTRSEQDSSRIGLRGMLKSVLEQGGQGTPNEVARQAGAFKALADPERLQVAHLLMSGDRTVEEVSLALHLPSLEAAHALRELEAAHLVVGNGEDADQRYTLASDQVRMGLAAFLDLADATGDSAEGRREPFTGTRRPPAAAAGS
jgi:membrane protein DedA with SNARE-associated domain/DNA-binding transcriptional ArsR family regulator